jgi:uncharacterized protein
MQVVDPICLADLPSTPWKNGGGSTRTLAVEPANASLDEFLWRISLAEIAVPGPFSSFSGIDRIISLWRGPGVVLHSPSWPCHTLDQSCEPFPFSGEDPVTCTLIDGPSTDFNLMFRRDVVRASLTAHTAATFIHQAADHCILLCNRGELRVEGATEIFTLSADYMIQLARYSAGLSVVPVQPGTLYIIILIHYEH